MTTLTTLAVARDIATLRRTVAAWRRTGDRIGLVPTMGALHEGHLALIDAARRAGAARVVVSIFVNPTQFAPHEDFTRYPRPESADLARLTSAGADLAYLPPVEAMYPPGFSTAVQPAGPVVADLEAAARPGHFAGVATVVAKLLLQSGADIAAFGEKDYQQYLVIRRLAADLDIPTTILPVPTIRDAHGLALSSRNVYLSADQLTVARRLNGVLVDIATDPSRLETAPSRLLAAGFDAIDYLVLRDAATLEAPRPGHPARVLAAARLGPVRLLDNMAVAASP